MSRPTKFNEKIVNHLLELLRQGHSFRDACFGVGISEDTFIRWRKAFPDFAEQVDSAKNQYWTSEGLKKYHSRGGEKRKGIVSRGINTHLDVGKALETALNAPERQNKTYMGLPIRYELPETNDPTGPFYYAPDDTVQFIDQRGIRFSCPSDLWSAKHSPSPYGDEWLMEVY